MPQGKADCHRDDRRLIVDGPALDVHFEQRAEGLVARRSRERRVQRVDHFRRARGNLSEMPTMGGVYVVWLRNGGPAFSPTNPGGRFKGKDPSVPADALRANWVDDANVVYIGEADDLRRRLREFTRFGEGAPIGHWGGRLIWQLDRSAELLVAWRETPEQVPREVEAEMIAAFREGWGKPPFANEPHRLGR